MRKIPPESADVRDSVDLELAMDAAGAVRFSQVLTETWMGVFTRLVAEVRRLRAELELQEARVAGYARDNNFNIVKLARVEALPDKWRKDGFDRESQAADMCIDLVRALRGD